MQLAGYTAEGRVADEAEGLVASNRGVGIDPGEADLIALNRAEIHDGVPARAGGDVGKFLEEEQIGVQATREPISTRSSGQCISARSAQEVVRAGTALHDVGSSCANDDVIALIPVEAAVVDDGFDRCGVEDGVAFDGRV